MPIYSALNCRKFHNFRYEAGLNSTPSDLRILDSFRKMLSLPLRRFRYNWHIEVLMYRWVTYLLLFSLIRLQFTCCCGSVTHWISPSRSNAIILEATAKNCSGNCSRSLHHRIAKYKNRKLNDSNHQHLYAKQCCKIASQASQAKSKSHKVNCVCCVESDRCEKHHHRHFLLSVRSSLTSELGLHSLVVTRPALPTSMVERDLGYLRKAISWRGANHSSMPILWQIGQLRV